MAALDEIMSYLEGTLHLTPAQAAGVAGNLTVESKLNPAASNPREGAIGIAQWEGGRRTALDRYAAATGGSETDLTTQLNYLWTELQGSESAAYQKLVATNDPGTAAAVFDQYYERSSGAARATRVADAQAIAAGRPVTTGATSSSSGGGLNVAPAGFLGLPSINDVGGLVMKAGAGLIAGALVIVGMNQAVKGSSS